MNAPLRFALVPKKETPEMVTAFNGEEVSFFDSAYSAMLAASPGNDLLERIVRALETARDVTRFMDFGQDEIELSEILNEIGGGHG